MNYMRAIAIAREALYDTGVMKFDGAKMVAIKQETHSDQLDAEYSADAYNMLAELQSLINSGNVAIIDRLT